MNPAELYNKHPKVKAEQNTFVLGQMSRINQVPNCFVYIIVLPIRGHVHIHIAMHNVRIDVMSGWVGLSQFPRCYLDNLVVK